MKRIAAIVLFATSIPAFGFSMMATLVRQFTSTSVTGQAITVCVYQVSGQEFERVMSGFAMCPVTIQVQ